MNIPDKAIEAISDSRAARAYLDGEDLEVIGLAVLEAAAPYLYAQALRDVAQDFGIYNGVEIYPVELEYKEEALAVRAHLRARADELDPHE